MLQSLMPWLGLVSALVVAVHQEPYILTGASVSSRSGSVPLRREISELRAEGGAQWDVYIRSLQAMQDKAHSDPLSYFQILGIHGKPFVEWNGAGNRIDGDWQGYCPHGEKLFLPWHRSFILLFEQVLVENAMRIALEYPQRYRYQYVQAAETLRSPYWDWAVNSDVPSATVPSKVRVNVPDGQHLKETEIDNPLLTFQFPEEAFQGEYGDFDSENRTKIYRCQSPQRYPESANAATAARPYKQYVYDAFTHSENFSDFASTGDGGISIEQVHNAIHWDAACGGQFLASSFSGFDPLFMLHHTNADRLWAYWQAIHPDHASFIRAYKGGSRFSTAEGTVIGPDSPLEPFFKSENKFHTSRSVENISTLGYSYQGLEYWDKSEAQMGANAKRLINQLYGPTDRSEAKLERRHDNRTTRYFARVQVEASELERPCAVEVYVGGRYSGSLVIMQHPSQGAIHGEFPIEETLDAVGMRKASTRKTLNSIQSSLEVAIIKADGKSFSVASAPNMRVEIEHAVVEPPLAEDDLPTYRNQERLPVAVRQRDASFII